MATAISATDYTKTYTTFSGCDIACSFGSTVIGELQAITYSVSREKAPVYTMGSAEVRSFSRGKRGIAGTLVFSVFDKDALIKGLEEHIKNNPFYRMGKDLSMEAISIDDWDRQMTDMLNEGAQAGNGGAAADAEARTKAAAKISNPLYGDEVPPFDITITFANEYGQKAVTVLYGVEILNEGQGFSIDTMVSEKACTFVARKVDYMRSVA